MAEDQPTSEQWKPVPGYAGRYEVSDRGRVRRNDWVAVTRRGERKLPARELKTPKTSTGHLSVVLAAPGGGEDRWLVHRLVLTAFVGPCPNGMECRHLNDNPVDNRLSNLCWGTRTDNMLDRTRNGIDNNGTKNATHCARGHAFDDENTIVYNDRHRACRKCRNDAQRKRHAEYREKNPVEYQTHCKRGHLLEGPNLRENRLPHRACKACHRGHARASRTGMMDHLQAITDAYYEDIMRKAETTTE